MFTIDEELSYLEILPGEFLDGDDFVDSGTNFCSIFAIVAQQLGGLTTKLGGTLVGDVNEVSSEIVFSSGSTIDALPNPAAPFLPAGGAGSEENFGGSAIFKDEQMPYANHIALRDAAADIVSGSAKIGESPIGRELNFAITQGVLDHNINQSAGNVASVNLPYLLEPEDNESTELVSGTLAGTITIPFSLSFKFRPDECLFFDSCLSMEGTIVAHRIAAGVPGDYSSNGFIDAADYTMWRDHLGEQFTLANENPDAMTPGEVDPEDYEFWKSRFSMAAEGSAAQVSGSVPEPASWLLLASGGLLIVGRRRARPPFQT